jgi:hypothetical protein
MIHNTAGIASYRLMSIASSPLVFTAFVSHARVTGLIMIMIDRRALASPPVLFLCLAYLSRLYNILQLKNFPLCSDISQ